MMDSPIKPSTGAGLLKGTAYVVALLLVLPFWLNGATWLNANQTFNISLFFDTGTFNFISGSGYLLACLTVGWLCKRFGTGTVLVSGTLLSSLACLGYALAPTWGVVEALGFLGGLGSGLVFTGVIIHFTLRFGMRPLLWWLICYKVAPH